MLDDRRKKGIEPFLLVPLLFGKTYVKKVLAMNPIAYWPLWEADPQENANLFNVNMETGDLSQFDASSDPDSDTSATAAAAMGGTATGMSCVINDQNAYYERINVSGPASGILRVRFYLDPNGLAMGVNEMFTVCVGTISVAPWNLFSISLRENGANFRLYWSAREDDLTWHYASTFKDISDAAHYIEFLVVRASSDVAGDGYMSLWVDGVLHETISDLDNYDGFNDTDFIDFGAIAGIDVGTSGTFYIDEIAGNDTGVQIGAVPSLPVVQCVVNSALNGTYTGVQLGQTGVGDGNTCPLFDAINDRADVYTAGLTSAFNGAEATVMIWVKPSAAGVWNDGVIRICMRLFTDQNNRIYIKSNGDNTVTYASRGAGTWSSVIPSSAAYGDTWQMLAITRSETADEFKAYRYVSGSGGQINATQTGLGIYAGALTIAKIGALDTVPNQVWDGYLAHCAVWDSALTPLQIADLAAV